MQDAARIADDAPREPGPRDLLAERRYAYAKALGTDGLWPEAADLFAQAIELAPGWVAAWIARAEALEACGDGAGASSALRQAALLDPGDREGAGLRLAAMTREAGLARGTGPRSAAPSRASPAYVGALFDGYAARFETHLTRDLAYRGPALLAAALDRSGHARFARALDLGCGTGLAGGVLRPLADRLEGVDLSAAMVSIAGKKALYDRLEVGDILAFLEAEADASADLVIAADVFVYLGDLAPILIETARVLARGGAVAFTTQSWLGRESFGDDGYRVGLDLRFAHTRPYIVSTLERAGFALAHWAEDSARRENERDVPGAVVVGRRL